MSRILLAPEIAHSTLRFAIRGEDGLYRIDSHLHLKTKKIKIVAPENINLYVGEYFKNRFTQIIFGVKGTSPAICSLLRRSDLNGSLVKLVNSAWLNPRETLNIFHRHFGASYPFTLTDCHPIKGKYPFS